MEGVWSVRGRRARHHRQGSERQGRTLRLSAAKLDPGRYAIESARSRHDSRAPGARRRRGQSRALDLRLRKTSDPTPRRSPTCEWMASVQAPTTEGLLRNCVGLPHAERIVRSPHDADAHEDVMRALQGYVKRESPASQLRKAERLMGGKERRPSA